MEVPIQKSRCHPYWKKISPLWMMELSRGAAGQIVNVHLVSCSFNVHLVTCSCHVHSYILLVKNTC
jgi:hypothetical protein